MHSQTTSSISITLISRHTCTLLKLLHLHISQLSSTPPTLPLHLPPYPYTSHPTPTPPTLPLHLPPYPYSFHPTPTPPTLPLHLPPYPYALFTLTPTPPTISLPATLPLCTFHPNPYTSYDISTSHPTPMYFSP